VYKDYPHWRKVIKILENEPYHWIILDHRFDPAAWGELGSKVTDCSGAFKLRYSAAVAIESDLFCSSDTGLLYVRLSQGKKAISLYGPHEPFPFLAHFQPHARGLRVPYVTGLLPDGQKSCSVGCFIDVSGCHGKGQYSPCMDQLAPEVVAAEIRSALAG
jgi:ADP-heptose:LPS heptosyltransferase